MQQEADNAKSQVASLVASNESFRQRTRELSTSLETHLSTVHSLQDDLITKEESFRNEMTTQSRLIELHERSAKDAKQRIRQLEQELDKRHSGDLLETKKWAQSYQDSQETVARLERRIVELEADLESARVEIDLANERSEVNEASTSNGIGLLSPSAHIISKVQASGMSLTQLYSEFTSAKQDLAHERRKNMKIQASFDELIQELEDRAPQLQAQREEYSMLQVELATMSEANQQIAAEKTSAETQSRELQNVVHDQSREIKEYQQQVTDLSRQVQRLLFEIEEQGFRANPLSEAEVTALNRLLETGPAGNSAVNNLISERLVLFKSIQELQHQNEQQLKITRQLGAKMEHEEESNRLKLQDIESSSLNAANAEIDKLAAELRSLQTKADSFLRERDMFRRMLTQNTVQRGEDRPIDFEVPQELEESKKALRELQSDYDNFRAENAIDRQTLSKQLNASNKERSDMSVQLARTSSQLAMAEEKLKMMSGSIEIMRSEVEESRKSANHIQELSAAQDRRTQQIADELIDTKAGLDQLRVENVHLTAEKQLWKSVEQRLAEELDLSRTERTSLSNLVANLQALHTERESSFADANRRSTEQIQALEAEIDDTKARLASEREDVRRLTTQRDQSTRETQDRIETLLRQCSDVRETLAGTTAEKENLRAQVQELTSALKEAQERLQVFNNPASNSDQQMQVEISDLRIALKHAESDSIEARAHAQRMQEVSAASEEALATMNQTHDEFVISMQQQIDLKDNEIESLRQRIAMLSSELEEATERLRSGQAEEDGARQLEQQELERLRAQNSRLSDIEEKYNIAKDCYQDDLKCQAEIAQEAHQNYENELLKHAEAAQSLRMLRDDYNTLRTEVLTLRKDSETSESRLETAASAWASQKSLYEQEISELRARLSDLQRQNNLLHTQFESFTAQMGQRSTHEASSEPISDDTQNVHEIIQYLRREKEIVEISYERLQQENKRTMQLLTQRTEALDKMQITLTSERQKAAQNDTNDEERGDLLTKLNELNLIRESNTTLRVENERNLKTIRRLESELENLNAKLDPLEALVSSSVAEQQAKDKEIQLLNEDNTRWKERNQAILQKYDRIDPAELAQLREKTANSDQEIVRLQQELKAQEDEVKAKDLLVTSLQEQVQDKSTKYDTILQQSRDRIRKERIEVKKNMATAQEYLARIEALEAELAVAKSSVETDLATVRSQDTSETDSLRARITALEAQLAETSENSKASNASAANEIAEAKAQIAALTAEKDTAKSGLAESSATSAVEQIKELEAQTVQYRADIEKLQKEFDALRVVSTSTQEALVSLHVLLSGCSLTGQNKAASTIEDLQARLESGDETKEDDSRITEEEIQRRIAEATENTVSEEEVQARIAAAVAKAEPMIADNEAVLQSRIDEALSRQPSIAEEEIQKRIEDAIAAKVKIESDRANEAIIDTERRIEELTKAKDEEAKSKVRSITKERVDQLVEQRLPKKVEVEKQMWVQAAEEEKEKLRVEKDNEWQSRLDALKTEMNAKLESQADSIRKESTMKVNLQMKGKDKEIATLKQKLERLSTAQPATESSNSKPVDPFADLSESEAVPETGTESNSPTGAAETTNTTAPVSKEGSLSFRGRGRGVGRFQRGAKRGGLQGLKRPRERENDGGDQPAKKLA